MPFEQKNRTTGKLNWFFGLTAFIGLFFVALCLLLSYRQYLPAGYFALLLIVILAAAFLYVVHSVTVFLSLNKKAPPLLPLLPEIQESNSDKDLKEVEEEACVSLQPALDCSYEREQATHDTITGFYNRNALSEIGGRALKEKGDEETVAFLYIGLTGFSEFQERFGMVSGNSYIRVCGEVFRRYMRPGLIPFRWWGSDFLLIVTGLK